MGWEAGHLGSNFGVPWDWCCQDLGSHLRMREIWSGVGGKEKNSEVFSISNFVMTQ